MANDLKNTLDAYVQEFGKEAVILELPRFMEQQAKAFDFGVRVEFIDSLNEIKIRSHSAVYKQPLQGLDKKT